MNETQPKQTQVMPLADTPQTGLPDLQDSPASSTLPQQISLQSGNKILQVAVKEKMVIGRRDESDSSDIDVDLAGFGKKASSVSRRHAMFIVEHEKLHLEDLGSTNFTQHNGAVIESYQLHPLQDGDKISFGKLLVTLKFE